MTTEALAPPYRKDSLPEHHTFADTGCHLHPACLTCPREACIYDAAGSAKVRQAKVEALRQQGWKMAAIAEAMSVTPRTVYRYLKGRRDDAKKGKL